MTFRGQVGVGGFDTDIAGVDFTKDTVCSDGGTTDGDEVCKRVSNCEDPAGSGSGLLEVGEVIDCQVEIDVDNDSGTNWTGVRIKDHFGTEWDISSVSGDAGCSFNAKNRLNASAGPINSSSVWECDFDIATNMDNSGNQRFTTCGYYLVNSGVNVKAREAGTTKQSGNHSVSYGTNDDGVIIMCVVDPAGGCDADGTASTTT